MSNINNDLVNSQLNSLAIQSQIDIKVARKSMDASRMQGEAALKLLDSAMEVAQNANTGKPALTMGAQVSGLGQNLDIQA